jgi:dTDP-glucose 4,6-dehydratase
MALILRFDGNLIDVRIESYFQICVQGILINALFLYLFEINRNRYTYGSLDQIIALSLVAALTAIFLFFIRVTLDAPNLPRFISLLSPLLTVTFQLSFRLTIRSFKIFKISNVDNQTKVLIYGAGQMGKQAAELIITQDYGFNLMGFIDDNSNKQKLRIYGRQVLGSLEYLISNINFLKPDVIFIAINSLPTAKLKDIQKATLGRGIQVLLLPNPSHIFSGKLQLENSLKLNEGNLLVREKFESENANLEAFFSGKRVLVTGAAGSIGSELIKQLKVFDNCKVFFLDRDENRLLNLKLDLNLQSDLSEDDIFLADIRDFERVAEVVEAIKPHVIFHAAALKHVSILQRLPEEAFKTNYLGTCNLLRSARNIAVDYFINISSDKAANPISELGKSKQLAEDIVQTFSKEIDSNDKKYLSVRFGNVIGSQGSFIEIFKRQIESGGPVVVRHPEATRYFMTIREAVNLILCSALVGSNGEILVLDMGKPIKIVDIANQMILESGNDIEITYSSLLAGEKIQEELLSDNEIIAKESFGKIWHIERKRGS